MVQKVKNSNMRKNDDLLQKSAVLGHLSLRWTESDNKFEFRISKLGLMVTCEILVIVIIFDQ